MICGNCQKEIRDGLVFCPNCGQKTGGVEKKSPDAAQKQDDGPSWKLFIAVLALIGVIGGGYYYYAYYYKSAKMLDAGLAARKHGDYKQCIDSLQYVIGKNPRMSGEARLAIGDCYIRNSDPDSAVKQMEDASSWDSKNAHILSEWSRALYRAGEACNPPGPACSNGKYQGAVEKAKMALILDNKVQEAWQYEGLAQLKLKFYPEAEKSLGGALANATPDDSVEIYNGMGEACLAQDKTDAAIRAYENSLKIYTNQTPVLIKLADQFHAMKDWPQCLSHAKRALEIAMQTNDQATVAKADALAKGCEATIKVLGIKDCIISRRQVDNEYIMLDSDLDLFLKELQANPGEHMGKPSTTLAQMLENDKGIKDEYSKLSCSTDYENRFQQTLIMFTAQLEIMKSMLTHLKNYVENNSTEDRNEFEAMTKTYSDKMKSLIDTWNDEETKFKLEPIFKKGAEAPKAGDKKAAPARSAGPSAPPATL